VSIGLRERAESSNDRVQAQARRARQQAGEAVDGAKPWLTRLGRFGFLAKGLVYGLIGLLAAQAAAGAGGTTTDTHGALENLALAPFGRLLLGGVAFGLVCYALWRFVQATFDTENKGRDLKGLYARAAYAIIGVIHLGLAFSAARLALSASDDGHRSTQDWTGWLLSQPFGQWLVLIVGAIVVGAAFTQLGRAYTAGFRKQLQTHEMEPDQVEWVIRIGRIGFAARGVVFGIIGGFLVLAGLQADPQHARGLADVLAMLAEQPFGPYLLGTVAVGLVAYGLFMLIQARYRRMVIR
jgi:hypothetical protein